MSSIFQLPKQVILSNAGELVPGAKAYFFTGGTSTPQATYTEETLTTAHAHPVIADGDGRFPTIYLDETIDYKVQVTDASDVTIYTQDFVQFGLTAAQISPIINPITQAETNGSVTPSVLNYIGTPWYDVRRVGIVPNDIGAATANTTALQGLLDPSVSGPRGHILFPDTTGNDTYYFDDRIPSRDHIHIEGLGSTINFTKTGESDDTNGGCFHFLRHCSLQNVKMVVNYTQVAGTNTFNAIALAGRDATAVDFPAMWDSLQSEPFGDIHISNVEIDMTGGTNSSGLFMLGGLQNCSFENIRIKGNGTLKSGVFYEYGFATNEAAAEDRESSHAHNLKFNNIIIEDIDTVGGVLGTAMRLTGVYNTEIDGLWVNGAKSGLICGAGEALYYRPWVGVDDAGITRVITMKNINLANIEGTYFDVNGATANTGYLSGIAIPDEQLTDLLSFSLDGYVVDGTSATAPGIGIQFSTCHAEVTNGQVIGCAKGIVATNEASHLAIKNSDVYDSGTIGIQIGLDSNIFSPRRRQIGVIENCHIAGSGATSTNAAIVADHCEMLEVNANRFGYETNHDGKAETTQTAAINALGDATVVAKDNYVAGVSAGNAYASSAGAVCVVSNPRGIRTADAEWSISGTKNDFSADIGDANKTNAQAGTDERYLIWDTAFTAPRSCTFSTTDAIKGDEFTCIRTANATGAFTFDIGGLITGGSGVVPFAGTVIFDGSAWIPKVT